MTLPKLKFPQLKIPKIPLPWFRSKPEIADFRILFMGSGNFAVPALKELLDLERLLSWGRIILAVFTRPDKPAGRQRKPALTPVKQLSLKYQVPVLEPAKINSPEWIKKIQDLRPDLIIVCAYGQIIPKKILDIPKFGCINIHPSLLPKYRGSSPIQTAILNGEAKTGVTIMLLDEKLDHGPILSQRKEKIKKEDTSETIGSRLAEIGAKLLISFLPHYLNGNARPQPQDHKKATFTQELVKEKGRINWQKGADEIERQIRAYSPWPGTWTIWKTNSQEKILKIIQAQKNKTNNKTKPGLVFLTKNNEFAINCRQGTLIVERLQLEGKVVMTGKDFLRGHGKIVGNVLH